MIVSNVWTSTGLRANVVLVLLFFIILRTVSANNTGTVRAKILTPPYFNLAEGKKITATATCGVDTEGPELYCKLVGANAENDLNVNLIQGQLCDVCDPTRPDKMHPPEFAVDGLETWWQSPPLSRGMKYNEVNLTIDLGQEFHVAYVFIKMGNSPRPGLWVLEKSADYGKTYTPWQYFSDSPDDCETYFGKESLQPITRDDSVICETGFSKIVPLEYGEIPISLLNNRPSANYYFNSTVLQEWTRATNVRLRLLRTKNLLGHLMSVARQDPTVTRRYFYSIKDISIGGRCMCNGHADTCDIQDPKDPSVLLCRCQHNTCGAKCEYCCSGFEQKKWRQSKHDHPFACEPCNCFQHSNECIFDPEVDKNHLSLDIHGRYEGGGVCQNCQHNTEGINCNKCKPKFYRPYNKHWNETDVCQPCSCDHFFSTGNCAEGSGQCECKKEFTPPYCDSCSFGYYGYPDCRPCECFLNGTRDLQCSSINGQCPCLYNFGGKYCKECSRGFYNFPECTPCECNTNGAVSSTCDQETGKCTCKNNFGGQRCDECQVGYYNYPQCDYCNCDIKGTKEGVCDKETGKCLCKDGYGGDRCDVCLLGYYGYPDCKPCNCSKTGSLSPTCTATGKCSCLVNYAGRTCDQCSPGYYQYPDCLSCDCDTHGANGVSCDNEGKCECHYNFAGIKCDKCKEGFYNFPACEDCNCHPAGVVAGFAGCGSVPAGELCQCKERVEGRICNKCKPLYWNLNPNNPDGCEKCSCNITGVLGGIAVCDAEDGQCICKSLVVARDCAECADGTYNLQEDNLFGCSDCDCDIGGSMNNICDKRTGQCLCQPRVTGRTCKEPLQAHYFPTLYQYQYEIEDGRTPANSLVRYANDDRIFPDYSWKGYAVFSLLQNKILQDVYIDKPSLYRMVLRFVNNNPEPVIGTIRIVPDNSNDNEQEFQVQFKSTSTPAFVTVAGVTGITPSPFVMNPGRWTISIEVHRNLLLDYFVLLPEDFYLATILNKKVEKPCTLTEKGLCREYNYLNLTNFHTTFGVGGYVKNGQSTTKLKEYFQDTDHLSAINVGNRVPLLNRLQPTMSFDITVNKPGLYVIIVNYVVPLGDQRTHRIESRVISGDKTSPGNAILYSCPYTTLCRQVFRNPEGGVGVYQAQGNDLTVDLISDNANVGIHSIVAIPYTEWSLDFIKPKSVCIKKDGNCIATSFRKPPETKQIQFEDGNNATPITLNNSTYVWLNPEFDSLDLKGKVANPGYYTFVVHYYQPNFHDFDVSILLQNGQFYEATVPVRYCPSLSGCRSRIVQKDGNDKFALTENFMITIQEPGKRNVYLDYLLVIPTDLYDDRYLEEEDVDRTGEFISTCGSNHFNIDTTVEGFCRDSVFSITAGHNSGALPCQCDYYGSLSFECDKFGGQCQCKPNIIGRRCEACKTGYYGFPDCKPCNCPSIASCEPSTGQCICPPRVIGEKCDQCAPYTYGFDPIIGCEECKCNPLGVVHYQLQCDLFNGSCPCKRNIVGRQCDSCLAGHHTFPHCENCECNLDGTVEEICDQVTAECYCKKHVVGPDCGHCREGTFNLQRYNEDGCTECFCFGKASRCSSSRLIRYSLMQMEEWDAVTLNTSVKLEVAPLNLTVSKNQDNIIEINIDQEQLKNKTIYFAAPYDYIGKKLTAYGGFLNYSIYYDIGDSGTAVSGPDVILEGRKTYLTYSSLEQPPSGLEYPASVQLVESNFELPSGTPAKRNHIMEVLVDLQAIYIRGTYWSDTTYIRLTNIIQDDAIPFQYSEDSRNLRFAISVEECHCPPNYQGLSCEECAPGHYRIEGPHGGYCVPCQCNGHSSECDVNTGVCFNCKHNTRGEHCEFCEVGYHGSALAGGPLDCLICACPLPQTSNNFATGCDVSSEGDKISCECREGYVGARCQSCGPGYYGKPESPGDYCKPCQCSGNIDSKDPSSCDTVTGECLRCLNNTFGTACALCAPGYFGDAVNLKNCQSCLCDDLGTDHCDSSTGECACKPNVIGEKCDRCKDDHYGFQSGTGCVPCNCSVASESDRCEYNTGQCRCKPGVVGRACDRCTAGYWNYTSEGCTSCRCNTEYSLGFGCNAQTGQCECLPGVIGEKCDQCPHRWVFIPNYGCFRCDSCTHNLLDVTDELSAILDPIIFEFDSANSGYFTRRKLENIQEQLKNLRLKFDEVDPKLITLEPYIQELESLEQDSKNLNRKTNYSLDNSESLKTKSLELQEKTEELLDDVFNAEDECLRVIDDIDKITYNLNKDENPEIEAALTEGQEILETIKNYDLEERQRTVNNELSKVNDLLHNVTEFKVPVNEISANITILERDLKGFNDKLDDLYNQTQYSLNKANEAQKIIDKSGKERLKKKLADIENQTQETAHNLVLSKDFNMNSSQFNQLSTNNLLQLQNLLDTFIDENDNFKTILDENEIHLIDVQKLKPNVESHANNLTERAMTLDSLLTETRDISSNALRAANAYKNIVDAVQNARGAAIVAQTDSKNAVDLLTGIEDKTFDTDQNSSESLKEAYDLYHLTEDKLKPNLNTAHGRHKPIQQEFNDNNHQLDDLTQILQNIQRQSLDQIYQNASTNADNAVLHVGNIEEIANETFTQLMNETEKAKSLPKDVDSANRDVLQTEKQLNTVNEKLPNIIQTIDEYPNQHKHLQRTTDNINNSLKKLNQQIALARDIANRIKIGMKFYPNTTLELQNPSNLEDLSTSTRISGYFKTDKPDGLIWYLGNPVGTNLPRTKTDDYMALVVQNGYPVLKLDIGNGPQQLISEKYVSDNNWYQFIIDRTGHNAKLSIREELPGGVENITLNQMTLDGPYSIFNLDRNKSKLFVGSFPVKYEMQNEIDFNSFDGEIEDLVIGDTPVSLWNFKEGVENYHGAKERDKLVNLQPSTGYRFNGNGYVIVNARSYSFRTRSDIRLNFKTFATEGLLFLAQKGKKFIALELRNGKLLYQYNLGMGTKLWHTSKTYNDGKWHTIEASRENANGRLVVDEENVPDRTKTISGTTMDPIETISFGGYPNKHNILDVTNIKFDGCIDGVVIMSSPLDLRNNIKAFDVTPGCPVKFARLVSFSKHKPGYLGHDLAVSNNFKITLKFKTKEQNGLIFYGSDNLQTSNISLAIRNGHLVLISQGIELVSRDTFNDSQWHVVSVMHNDRELRVDFDDFGHRVTDSPPPSLYILHGTLYLAGLPRRIRLSPGTVGSQLPFSGCIGDLTLNGNVINFANTTDKINEILGKCVLDEVIDENDTGVHVVPVLPPLEEVDIYTTTPPGETTKSPKDSFTTLRGDGGWDWVPTEPDEPIQPPPEVVKPTEREREPGRVPPTTPAVIEDACALPLDPIPDETSQRDMYRLGTQKDSRLEYLVLRGKYRKQFDFRFEFKSSNENGIIFYMSDRNQHQDYVALLLQKGRVVYTYKSGGVSTVIKSDTQYNDDTWHYVEFSREDGRGKLVIDGGEPFYGNASGAAQKIDLRPPLYIGGLDPIDYNIVAANLNNTENFKGCVRNLHMNNKPLESPTDYGIVPCSENVETGTFFGSSGGYIKLKNSFRVGELFSVKLDIKPRLDSGILIAAHGRRDYLVLEMVKGLIKFTVDNGRGPITAAFRPKQRFYVCDGQWHNIQAVKSKSVVTLSVDNVFTDPSLGDHHDVSADTGSALFLGGHRFLKKARGINSRQPYIGCIKNVYINNEFIEILPTMADGNITVGSCRTD